MPLTFKQHHQLHRVAAYLGVPVEGKTDNEVIDAIAACPQADTFNLTRKTILTNLAQEN